MRSYTLAALTASFCGWLVALTIYGACYYILNKEQALGALLIVGYYTLVISLVANVLFVQLPRYFIKNIFFKSSHLAFGIGYSILAYSTLQLTFGSAFGHSPVEQLATFNPIINGFVLGFIFHYIWKPVRAIS